MGMPKHLMLVIALTYCTSTLWAQVHDKPNPPTLDYITNDLSTGHITIYWTKPIHEPQYPDPLGYIIYIPMNYETLDSWVPIDTVDKNTFQYAHIGANGNGQRVYYRVASQGATEPSQMTEKHSQVWITAEYDSCNAELKISWKGYEGWDIRDTMPYQNIRYQLFMGNNIDASTYEQICDIGAYGGNRYTVKNVQENLDYYFYIRATRQDTALVSFSNRYLIHTKMARRPRYVSIDSVIATNNGNWIYYTIDDSTEITDFKLWRWEQPDTAQSIFSAKLVESFITPTQSMSIDTNDTWAARTRNFYYKVDAYNGCGQAIKVSNLCNSIIPKLKPKGTTVNVQWNEAFLDTLRTPERKDNHIEYALFRRSYTINDPLDGQGSLDTVATGLTVTEFTDDLSAFKGQNPLYRITFGYYVEAYEITPGGDTVTLSRSRDVFTEILPGVTMPTALAPNDNTHSTNGNRRNFFKPVINFEARYTLTIYDRWGGIVYHGNEGWDGRNSRGEFVKEGTYLYRLIISTSDAGDIVKTGSVSVVYPK